MQKDVEAGFAALFEFNFDRYLTLAIARLVYRLAFALACLLVLASLILIFTYVGDALGGTDYGTLIQIVLLALTAVSFVVFLATVRLFLEALVVHFKGHQKELLQNATAPQPAPTAHRPRAIPVADPIPAQSAPVADPIPAESASERELWTCRCGHKNPASRALCGECKRSRDAII